MSQIITINEIFGSTIQGEGPNIGARCIFVRVQGCDYRCSFCDSKRTWKTHIDCTSYTPDELSEYLLGFCKRENCNRVVLTGGNPCLYDFSSVVKQLQDEQIKIDIETQGSLLPEWITSLDTVVFSPKPPSSRMKDTYDIITNYIYRYIYLDQTIAIKIPVFTDEDLDFARKYAEFVNKYYDCNNLKMYLSVGNSDVSETGPIRDRILQSYEELLNKINNNPEHFENVYILPQLHTLVWGNKQGV